MVTCHLSCWRKEQVQLQAGREEPMTGCKDRQNEYQNDMQTSAYFRTHCHISGTCTRFYKKDTAEPLYLHINKSFINIGKMKEQLKEWYYYAGINLLSIPLAVLCDRGVWDSGWCILLLESLGGS